MTRPERNRRQTQGGPHSVPPTRAAHPPHDEETGAGSTALTGGLGAPRVDGRPEAKTAIAALLREFVERGRVSGASGDGSRPPSPAVPQVAPRGEEDSAGLTDLPPRPDPIDGCTIRAAVGQTLSGVWSAPALSSGFEEDSRDPAPFQAQDVGSHTRIDSTEWEPATQQGRLTTGQADRVTHGHALPLNSPIPAMAQAPFAGRTSPDALAPEIVPVPGFSMHPASVGAFDQGPSYGEARDGGASESTAVDFQVNTLGESSVPGRRRYDEPSFAASLSWQSDGDLTTPAPPWRGFAGLAGDWPPTGSKEVNPLPWGTSGVDRDSVSPGASVSSTAGSASSVFSKDAAAAPDLTRTNELLQQLLDEVRKGGTPFLPVQDRSSL